MNHYAAHLKLTQCCKSTILQLKRTKNKISKSQQQNDIWNILIILKMNDILPNYTWVKKEDSVKFKKK